ASVGMLLSLLIALIVTPWLSLKLLKPHGAGGGPDAPGSAAGVAPGSPDAGNGHEHAEGTIAARLHRFFERLMAPFLDPARGARRRHLLFAAMGALVLLAVSLAGVRLVVMKMMPFDNKSELQVVIDLPEGRTLEDTGALLGELAAVIDTVPEVLN